MDPDKNTIQNWDTLAQVYQDKFMHLDLYNDTYDAFCRLVAKPGARIFEIACGPGNIARYLLSQRPDYDILATDAAPNMVELAQINCPTAKFEVLDARNIDKINGRFDAVVCGFCLPYLSREDVEKLFRYIATLLEPDGHFYLSAIEGDYEQSGMVTGSTGQSMYQYYYAEAELLAALLSNGFKTMEVWRKPHDGEKHQWIWVGRRNIILETPRLYLREMTPADAENAYLLNLDPEVVQYTGDGPFESVEEAKTFLEKYDHYRKYGFGRWAVILKETGEYLGWCGLKYTADLDEFDIGFRFFKKHWNKGYATEASKPCIELGFKKFNMPEIVGRAIKANTGSIRVLEKCGLTYAGEYDFEGEEEVIYNVKC